MKQEKTFSLTREKHLDHMVKVVPFIVFCYAIQCFMVMKIAPGEFATVSMAVLGGFLAMMIGGFVTYDLKHEVHFYDDHMVVSFLGSVRKVKYLEIISIDLSAPGQTFATLRIKTIHGTFALFFMDDADKIKKWLLERNQTTSMAA